MPNMIQEVTFCLHGLIKRFFFKLHLYNLAYCTVLFSYLAISPSWTKMWLFIWINMCNWILFTQGYSVRSLVEIGQVVLEKIFYIFNMMLSSPLRKMLLLYIHYVLLFPSDKGHMALQLNKLASSSLRIAICQVWWILTRWYWRS